MPVTDKASHNQPDFRVLSKGVEIGAGWLRLGQMSGKEYVSLSISAPELRIEDALCEPRPGRW